MAAAALQAQRLFLTASTSSSSPLTTTRPRRTTVAPCRAGLRVPSGVQTTTTASSSSSSPADGGIGGLKLDWIDVTPSTNTSSPSSDRSNTSVVEKLRAVAEAAADRAEMHDIIGRQRDNWNHLLLHSTNSLTLAASAMAALAPAAAAPAAVAASAGVLLATSAVTMAAVNKVQPSQLAEEQRNATRLWRQLERDVRATLEMRDQDAELTQGDVQDAMDRVLALDAAYPLPLLPGMLEKFPKTVEPARWWPARRGAQQSPRNTTTTSRSRSFGTRRGVVNTTTTTTSTGNGWSQELEDELRGLLRVLRAKDEHQYLKVGKLVLTINRSLAVAGPALAGTAAVAAAFIGDGSGAWASGAAVACGALAAAVNTVEHGAQLGMLFELLRNCAGFYRKVQEDIEAALAEADVERRENGDVFRTKVALLLGRDAAELRQFRRLASVSVKDEDIKDYAGKLF